MHALRNFNQEKGLTSWKVGEEYLMFVRFIVGKTEMEHSGRSNLIRLKLVEGSHEGREERVEKQ